MCNPPENVVIQQEALDITGIKLEDVRKAPALEVVWPQFVSWVEKYNKKKSKWDAPIAVGQNIRGFDLPIAARCNKLFAKKKEDTILFNTFNVVDLLDILYPWFENSNELPKFKLDVLREYFGISKEGSHRALKDVEDTAAIVFRFLKYHRALMASGKTGFRGAFKQNA